ncbi:MAG TPA: DASS family sodium-coupled anion symporter, partial [Myxococcales bacterium]|nr:DASS family sodium-coupled anion symporter [Myxococcales bacterium]
TPQRLLTAILTLAAGMSCIMSCHAVAAMFFPVIHSIRKGLSLKSNSTYGKALYLTLAWGSTIGGTATLLGSGRAPLAVAILQENAGTTISFTDWALLSFPTALVMLIISRFVLGWMFPTDIDDISGARQELREQVNELGKLSYREWATGALITTTIMFWMFAGDSLGLATISLLAVVAAFVIGCATWSEVEDDVNWGIVLMYGGAIALGLAMLKTGASAWLAERVLEMMPSQNPIVLLGVVAFIALWMTEALSNAAVVALIMPPVIGMAQQLGIDPRLVALFVAIPCGYAFVMPMGTPGTALAFSGGFLRQRDTLRAGTVLKMCVLVVFLVFSLTLWPWLGYGIQV